MMIDEKDIRISIVVPVYNVAPYLPKCLDSLLAQTLKKIEIIIVDDGSTDGSSEICDRVQSDDIQIVVIHQENKGVSNARNAGIKRARGEYIGFVDPDDYVEVDMYNNLYISAMEEKADIVACSFVHEFENGRISFIQHSVNKVLDSESAIKHDMIKGMYVTWNKIFSKKIYSNILYDEKIVNGEDRLYDVTALMNANKVVYIDKPYYHYFHRENSAGTKEYTEKDMTLIYACEKINKLLLDNGKDMNELVESQFHNSYILLLGMMKFEVDKYNPDGDLCIKRIRESFVDIMRNKYNGFWLKTKALIACASPRFASFIYNNINNSSIKYIRSIFMKLYELRP